MSFQDILLAMRRRWIVLLLVTLLTVGAATGFALRIDERYESTSTVALLPNTETSQGAAMSAETFSVVLGTYAARASSSVTLSRAQSELGRPLPGEIEVSTEAGNGLLRFRGTAGTAEDARTVTGVVTDVSVDAIRRSPLVQAEVIQPPSLPSSPYWPRPVLTGAIALLVGLGLGAVAAVGVDRLRRRVEAPEEAAEIVEAPIVGRLPATRAVGRLREPLGWESDALLPLHASLRTVRANLEHANVNGRRGGGPVRVGRAARVILVSSATGGQGKSTLVAGLGLAFAQVDVETVIVDADIYKPRQHELFGVADDEDGLNQLLTSQDPAADFDLCATTHDRLSLLPAGPAMRAASDLLQSRIGHVLDSVVNRAGVVLIDAPPVLEVSDAKVIAPRASDLLLVTSSGSERPHDLSRAVREFALVGSAVTGLVVNRIPAAEIVSSAAYAGVGAGRSA